MYVENSSEKNNVITTDLRDPHAHTLCLQQRELDGDAGQVTDSPMVFTQPYGSGDSHSLGPSSTTQGCQHCKGNGHPGWSNLSSYADDIYNNI